MPRSSRSPRPPAARLARALGLAAPFALTVAAVAAPSPGRAESAPALPGYAPLGEVRLDKTGCPSCPVTFSTDRRHRTFALTNDSPFPVVLAGRVEVTCANGSTYHVLLGSPRGGGPFQVVQNACTNLDAKSVSVDVTSVGLAPPDAERKVTLTVYGSFG